LCEKHPALPVIFEKKELSSSDDHSTKYCERCFSDYLLSKESIYRDDIEEEKSSDSSYVTTKNAMPK
jgi:hypothetical protein